MFTFGVDSFIWAEVFSERDLWIIPKARELGFETLDIAIAHPETFPTEKVRKAVTEAGIRVVTTTTLNKETNLISPDPAVRARGVSSLKTLVDINYELGSTILGGVNYAGWGCITGKPRTEEEWAWSVEAMREAARYAKKGGDHRGRAGEPVRDPFLEHRRGCRALLQGHRHWQHEGAPGLLPHGA
jgi:D-psicose/D-tagatose/L-ribulose 3-epimerase